MKNVRLVLEYDGAGFAGWQCQPGQRTIQGELERVLGMVLRCDPPSLCAAGRTDAGVHAAGQVVNFLVDETVRLPDLHRISHSASHLLKGEVSVLSAEFVSPEFNARACADSKQYRYRILRRDTPAVLEKGRVWHVNGCFDLGYLQEQAALLVGEHDFTSLRGAGCESRSPIRHILASGFEQHGDVLEYKVIGTGFLKQMVRNIVGTLIWLGLGKLALRTIPEVLAARDRRAAGVTAPAHGLQLDWVRYGDWVSGPCFALVKRA